MISRTPSAIPAIRSWSASAGRAAPRRARLPDPPPGRRHSPRGSLASRSVEQRGAPLERRVLRRRVGRRAEAATPASRTAYLTRVRVAMAIAEKATRVTDRAHSDEELDPAAVPVGVVASGVTVDFWDASLVSSAPGSAAVPAARRRRGRPTSSWSTSPAIGDRLERRLHQSWPSHRVASGPTATS